MKPGVIIGIIAVLIAAWYFFLRDGKTIAGEWVLFESGEYRKFAVEVIAEGINLHYQEPGTGAKVIRFNKHASLPNVYFMQSTEKVITYYPVLNTLEFMDGGSNRGIATRTK